MKNVILLIMISFIVSCGEGSKDKISVEVKNSVNQDAEQKISDDEYRTDITWENLEETMLKIRYFLFDADLQIKFEKNNILYSKGQFDKNFIYKGYWKVDSSKKVIMLDIKDNGNKSKPFFLGNFNSFCVLKGNGDSIHSIIFHRNVSFPKLTNFDDFLSNSDYLILLCDPNFKE